MPAPGTRCAGRRQHGLLIALGTHAYGFSVAVTVFDLPTCLLRGRRRDHHTGADGQTARSARQRRTSDAIAQLIRLHRKRARRARRRVIEIEIAQSGSAIFSSSAGEAIPVDGIVLEGASSINEAMLTGESMPSRNGRMPVYAATLNQEGCSGAARRRRQRHRARGHHPLVAEAQGSRRRSSACDRISGIFVRW